MTKFRLQIITPDRVFFDGMTEGVIVRTTVGDKGILSGHEAYVAALAIGKIRVNVDGQYSEAAVSSGIIKVGREKTVILAQSCEWRGEIDLNRAREALEKAEIKLKSEISGHEFDMAEFKLKRALNRIEIAGD